VTVSAELYQQYTDHLLAELNTMPCGTRLATFWLSVTEIPGSYKLKEVQYNNLLKLWVKEE